MSNNDVRLISAGYQLFMFVLCIYALGALALQVAVPLDPETRQIFDYADYVVCFVFFADFLSNLLRAEDRWKYMKTWGWLDLVSSIPAVDIMRVGRAGRVFRIVRVLRGLRAAKHLATMILRRRAESTILVASLFTILLVVFSSVAVLHFETTPESTIKTAEDAIWWSVGTITTVDFGNRNPVTSEGRAIAVILMCAGVALFGTFSGLLAAWLVGTNPDTVDSNNGSEVKELREEIEKLRRILENNKT